MKDNLFKYDYIRNTGRQNDNAFKRFVTKKARHQINYINYYRKYQKRHSPVWKLLAYRITRKYGLEISMYAKIGKGLYLGHPYNITVAGGVVIGNNVNLHKGCTIGRENRGKRKGVPTIGSRVSVGINSTIVGKVTIGDDVMIAPNTYVNIDVPSHSVVVGSPAQIHHRENATENYVGNLV